MAVRFSIDWDVLRKDADRDPDAAKRVAQAKQIRALKRQWWVYQVLLMVALVQNLWSLGQSLWLNTFGYQTDFAFLTRNWSAFPLVWLAPLLIWGLFTKKGRVRVLAIGVLAGVFLVETLRIGSQLFFLFYILSTSSLNWNSNQFWLQITLQIVGLFSAVRLFFIDLRLQGLEPVQPRIPAEPVADLPNLPSPRTLFDRLAPWLAIMPLLLVSGLSMHSGVILLWDRNSWDAGIGLIFFVALGGGAVLAARSRPRWRLLACGMATWFAMRFLFQVGPNLYWLDRDETYFFFSWYDPHGRYLSAWWLFLMLMMAVALRAIFRLLPRDFAAATTGTVHGALESATADVEDTVAQNTHWDESGPTNPPQV